MALLFGIAAQFRAMDGYSFLRRLIFVLEPKLGVLYAVVFVTALISPVVLNDVLILILTPVLVKYAKLHQVDVAPLLVAEITFTNTASSLTPFGNPQNILLWQASGIPAQDFVAGTAFPITFSLLLAAAAMFPLRRRLGGARELPTSMERWAPAVYLVLVSATVFSLDIAGIPSVLGLAAAFFLGFAFTYRSLEAVYKEFDLRSLATLFVLVGSVAVAGVVVQPYVGDYAARAASGEQPFSALFVGILSNAISNVPATQLILGTTTVSAHEAPRIAVEAGLAGNILPLGSFANILALTLARRGGVSVKKAILLQAVVGLVSYIPAFL